MTLLRQIKIVFDLTSLGDSCLNLSDIYSARWLWAIDYTSIAVTTTWRRWWDIWFYPWLWCGNLDITLWWDELATVFLTELAATCALFTLLESRMQFEEIRVWCLGWGRWLLNHDWITWLLLPLLPFLAFTFCYIFLGNLWSDLQYWSLGIDPFLGEFHKDFLLNRSLYRGANRRLFWALG